MNTAQRMMLSAFMVVLMVTVMFSAAVSVAPKTSALEDMSNNCPITASLSATTVYNSEKVYIEGDISNMKPLGTIDTYSTP